MWRGFDPAVQQQLTMIKKTVMRRYEEPSNEWALVVVEDRGSLLVVREWPDGALTAYAVELPER